MTKYEEMQAAARESSAAFNQYCERACGYFADLLNALMNHAGVPYGAITFLKWNEQIGDDRAYLPPEDGKKYTLQGAVHSKKARVGNSAFTCA